MKQSPCGVLVDLKVSAKGQVPYKAQGSSRGVEAFGNGLKWLEVSANGGINRRGCPPVQILYRSISLQHPQRLCCRMSRPSAETLRAQALLVAGTWLTAFFVHVAEQADDTVAGRFSKK